MLVLKVHLLILVHIKSHLQVNQLSPSVLKSEGVPVHRTV
ncbi:hypothetical protein GLYMA_04G134150v4 [Glycine max]|nr:hypothetical protein GLYMA_04G134150v4 [Glycine max]KAH1111205.1 hypothetical protein GYH30_009827 [Glycine max]